MEIDINDIKAQKALLNQEVAERFEDDIAFRKELAAALGANIWEGFEHENVIDLFSTVRRVGLDDIIYSETVTGLKSFRMNRSGYPEESSLWAEREEITKVSRGIHVSSEVEQLTRNFTGWADRLVPAAGERLSADLNRDLFTTYTQAAPANGSANNATSANGLGAGALRSAIAAVKAAGGTDVKIVGQAPMTMQIADLVSGSGSFNAYLPYTNEEIMRTGAVASWYGTDIVELENFSDEDGIPYIPGNELWVVAKNSGQTVFYGEGKPRQWEDNATPHWHYSYVLTYGMTVERPDRIYRIIDSGTAP